MAQALCTLTLAGACILSPCSSHAALLAYEGFNYSTGSGNLSGQAGGFGWQGAWQTINNGAASVQSVGLTAAGNAPAGYDGFSSGKSVVTPNNTRTGRALDVSTGGSFGTKGYLNGNGSIGAAGKTLYISFLQQPNGVTSYYEFEFHRGDLGDPGRVGGVGNDSGSSTSVYLRVPSAGQTAIGAGSTAVNFYVVRIDFLGGNDTVSVYQNPTSATEPGSPTLAFAGAGDMSFNGISFGAFNNGRTLAHDEVRLGETWADVVSPGTYSTGAWDGGGANDNWSSAGNWDNNVVPVFASSLTFAGSTRLNNTNDLTGVSANSITFDAAAGAFTLNGNGLGLNGNIGFSANPSSLITQTINLPLAPSGNFLVDTRTNGNLTINGSISGLGSELTQTSTGNAGVLTLAGTNSLKGLVINGGTNRITGTTAINGIGGSSFFYLADAQTSRKGTLVIENGANFSVVGGFQDAAVIGRDGGSGTIIQNGGTFTFNINDGSHEFLFIGASGNPATRSEYDMNGGVLDMNGKTLGVALGANTTITGMVNQVGGVITNVGNLLFSPFFSQGYGIYNLNGGSLYIGSGGITAFAGAAYELNLGGGTLGALTTWASALNMRLTGSNGPVTFNPAGNVILLSGSLSGPGGLTVLGPGALELSGANTYAGDTTVNAGSTLQLDVTGSSTGSFRLANGSALFLNFSGTFAVGGFYTNGVALPVGTYNAGNLSGFITGTGNLQVTHGISAGYWTGAGANNNWSTAANWDNNAVPIFPHDLSFTNGSRLVNNNDLSSLTVSTLTFGPAAGAFTLGGNDITLSGGIGFSGNPAAPLTQTVNLGIFFTGNPTFNLPTNGNLSLGGSLSSAGGLVKAGPGTLTLGGSDVFSSYSVDGGTNVLTGSLTINGADNSSRFYVGDIGTVGTLVIQPGASLNVVGSLGDAGVLGRDSGSGFVIQNGGTFSFSPGNTGYLFVGASSSAATRAEYDLNGGTLDMNNLTLAVALSANGATLITGVVNQVSGTINNVGKLDLGAFTFGPGRGIYRLSGGSIYLGAGGIQTDSGVYELYLGGGTVGALTSWSSPLNMTLTGSNGPVSFDTVGNIISLTGILSGPGGLNVTGGGILELGGANTFAGDIAVTAGALQLDTTGSSAGALRLATSTTVNLNFGGNYVVGGFFTNGVALPNGTYNAANLPAFITGFGNLVVQAVSTGQWTGTGANNNWSTAANWDHNALPLFPIGLTFGGSTRLNNTNDLPGAVATSLSFGATAGAFTLNGNSLGLSGDVSFTGNPAAPITQTLNLPLTVNANINIAAPANGTLNVNGDIAAGNNTVYKLGAGTLSLNGNNTLAGFDADGGTTVLTGTTSVTGTGGTRAYVANGDYVGGAAGTLLIQNGATFSINGTFADAYVIGRDSGIGTVTQNGGTFNFAIGNNPYLFVGAGNNPSTRGTYNLNGGTLDMNGNTLGIGLGAGGASVTGVVNQASGILTNADRVVLGWNFGQIGRGIYNMTGGSLYIGPNGIQTQTGIYEVYLGGGTVGAEADWSSVLNMTLTGINGPTTFNPAGNTITLSGVLSGAGGLGVYGGGILELSGANTYTGDTAVAGGSTLRLDSTSNGSGSFRLATGATLQLNYVGTLVVNNLSTNAVALAAGIYNASNLPGYLTGSGSIQVLGTGQTPPPLSIHTSAGQISLSWATTGWRLQFQTNAPGAGLGTNWVNVAGSTSLTSTNIPINPSLGSAFYRLQ